MAELSPSAQAVLDAFRTSHTGQGCLAAALSAVVDQTIPLTKTPWESTLTPILTATEIRNRLLAIAAELVKQ